MRDQQCVKLASWRRFRGLFLGSVGSLSVLLAVGAVLLKHEPACYRSGAFAAHAVHAVHDLQDDEALARRAVTKASALHAAISRPGPWEMAVTDRELNAWLAVDLPRNHQRALPRGLSEPRVMFRHQHAMFGLRVGYGLASAVATLDFQILLRDVNHVAILLEQARLGAVPLPRTPILRELARRINMLGMVTDIRRLDDSMVLMIYIPSTHDAGATSYWLESLAMADGELLLAGTTRMAAEPRHTDGTAPPP